MQDQENLSEIKIQDQKIMKNSELSIFEAIIPIIILVGLLAYNVFIFGDDSLSGSNQFILLIGGAVAAIVGFRNNVSFSRMMDDVAENVKSTSSAIFILLMVGALAGTWLVSGIIPTMIYYGLQILNPTIFLPACLNLESFLRFLHILHSLITYFIKHYKNNSVFFKLIRVFTMKIITRIR